jgi:S1-C subfamily serine protease
MLAGCAHPPAPGAALDIGSLTQQAEKGNAIAENQLGFLYATGQKVPQDFSQARKWYELAASHGNAVAEFNLGFAYEHGQGTPINLAEALHWYQAAADHNNPGGKMALGIMYQNGKGVPQDDAEALRWYRASAIQGWAPAQLTLASFYSEGGHGVEPDDGLAYEWASLAIVRMKPVLPVVLQVATRLRDQSATNLSLSVLTTAQAATTAWQPGTDLVSPFPADSGPRPMRSRGQGSGFIVGKKGEIATDFHVVRNCRELRLKDSTGKFNVTSHVVAQDKDADVAIIAGGGFGSRLKLRGDAAALGENVITYGFPLGQMLSVSGNLTTGAVSSVTGFQGNAKTLQISAPIQPGSSGGPVVDQSGAVIGLSVSGLNALMIAAATGNISQNINFATHVSFLRALMDRSGIAYETAGAPHPQTNTELAEELQKATVKIECWR